MVRKSIYTYFVVAALLLPLFWSEVVSGQDVSGEEIPIGWIGFLTGKGAALGVDALEAVEMAFEEINQAGGVNGRRLRAVPEDTQWNTSKAVSAYNKLVRQTGVKIILVYGYSAHFALSPLAQKDGVVLIDPLNCDEKIAKLPDTSFCIAKRNEDLGISTAVYAYSKGELPAGIIYYEDDAFPLSLAETVQHRLKELGGEVALFEGYDSRTVDFKPLLLKARSAQVKSLFLYGGEDIGTAIKQAKEIGLESQLYTLSYVTSPSVRALAGDAIDGVIFSVWRAVRSPRFSEFVRKFSDRTGHPPIHELSTIPSYDVAQIVGEAVKKAIKAENQVDLNEIKHYLFSLKDYPGVSGKITMDPDGIVRSFDVSLQTILAGKVVDLD